MNPSNVVSPEMLCNAIATGVGAELEIEGTNEAVAGQDAEAGAGAVGDAEASTFVGAPTAAEASFRDAPTLRMQRPGVLAAASAGEVSSRFASGASPVGNAPAGNGTPTHSDVQVIGVPKGASDAQLDTAIRLAVNASIDLSKVEPGDDVVIVAALNSDEPYPATAHPQALKTLAAMLQAKDAHVTVISQAGIEYVVQGPSGMVRGHSEDCYAKSGMAASGVEFHPLERDGWESGFTHVKPAGADHWPRGFYIGRRVAEADHVVVVSRISTHGMGGMTLGLKNLVGIQRLDSRVEFHDAGPISWFVDLFALGSGIKHVHGMNHAFFEMIAEIALAIQHLLRGQLIVGTEQQTTMGPNEHLMKIWGRGLWRSYVYEPPTGLVIASSDIVAADAVAMAALADGYSHTPMLSRFWQKVLTYIVNRQISEPDRVRIYEERTMRRALRVGLGKPANPIFTGVPAELEHKLREMLRTPG